MSGLSCKHQTLLGALAIRTNRMHILVERMESSVGQPSFVKMQRVKLTIKHLFDHFNVIDDAIVSALSQRHDAWHHIFILNEWISINFLLDIGPLKFFFRNRSNNAKMIAGWHQENRNRAHHGDRMNHWLMAVAIYHYDIARSNGRVPNNFVGCRCAISNEEQMVCIKDAGSVTLALEHRARMV